MLKLSENPPVLYPENTKFEEIAGPWWVGHTKASLRKGVRLGSACEGNRLFLADAGTGDFFRRAQAAGDEPHVSVVCFLSWIGRGAASGAGNGQALSGDSGSPINGRFLGELANIEQAIRRKSPRWTRIRLAIVGKRCHGVKSGPFLGVEGRVIERESVTSLVLEVSMLGQGVSLQIDTDVLEADWKFEIFVIYPKFGAWRKLADNGLDAVSFQAKGPERQWNSRHEE